MLWDYIKEVLGTSISGAMEGQATVEFALGLLLFCAPMLVRTPKLSEYFGQRIQQILNWKFFTDNGWRLAVVAIFFITIHLFVLSPYELYRNTKEALDRYKPSLEPELIDATFVTSGTNNFVVVDLNVFNKGKQTITRNWGLVLGGRSDMTNMSGILCDAYSNYHIPMGDRFLNSEDSIVAKTQTKPITENGMEHGHVLFELPQQAAGFMLQHKTQYWLLFQDSSQNLYMTNFSPKQNQ